MSRIWLDIVISTINTTDVLVLCFCQATNNKIHAQLAVNDRTTTTQMFYKREAHNITENDKKGNRNTRNDISRKHSLFLLADTYGMWTLCALTISVRWIHVPLAAQHIRKGLISPTQTRMNLISWKSLIAYISENEFNVTPWWWRYSYIRGNVMNAYINVCDEKIKCFKCNVNQTRWETKQLNSSINCYTHERAVRTYIAHCKLIGSMDAVMIYFRNVWMNFSVAPAN